MEKKKTLQKEKQKKEATTKHQECELGGC